MYSKFKYIMAGGHLCADFYQGVLSSILPFLIAAHNLDYATAASLVMVSNIVGSVIQPVFGHMADKKEMPHSMIVGLLMAGGGMVLTGYISSFIGLCICVMISGTGIALFHPMGALLTNRSADKTKQASSMSIFSFGGTLGFTLGPIAATAVISLFGLKGMVILLLPIAVEIAALLFNDCGVCELCRIAPAEEDTETTLPHIPNGHDDWSGFFRLCLVIFGRSIVFYSFNTFISLYWIGELGVSEVAGNSALTFFYALNAAGTLLGGSLADRFGIKRTVLIGCIIMAPFPFLITMIDVPVIAMVMAGIIGAILGVCHSPLVTSGQNMLPHHQGLASGVTLGLSVSIGGIFAPLLGSIGNVYGLKMTFIVTGLIAVFTLVMAIFMPKEK